MIATTVPGLIPPNAVIMTVPVKDADAETAAATVAVTEMLTAMRT